MKKRSFLESFSFALQGLIFVSKSQRNMRIHFLIAVAAILAGLLLHISSVELVILFCAIAFVLIAEIINTALELTLDSVNNNRFNPSIKKVKDVAAAAVLIASINAALVGCFIFLPHLR